MQPDCFSSMELEIYIYFLYKNEYYIVYVHTCTRARARACVCVYVHPCTQSCFSKIKQICDCLRCWQLAIYLSSIICFRRIHRQYSNIQATMHIYIYIYMCVCVYALYILYTASSLTARELHQIYLGNVIALCDSIDIIATVRILMMKVLKLSTSCYLKFISWKHQLKSKYRHVWCNSGSNIFICK